MDKSWVHLSRADPAYVRGAWSFVRSVAASLGDMDIIVCPCIDCRNVDRHSLSIVVEHLVTRGMDEVYKLQKDWYHHGEVHSATDGVTKQWNEEVYELYRAAEYLDKELATKGNLSDIAESEDRKEDEFLAKLADAETPLYPSCANHSKLSAITTLFRIKTQNGWSDKSFNELLETLPDMLPKDNVVSDQFRAKRRTQIPHTCSRKGMVRLAEDMKKESSDPSQVTRMDVWIKSRTKKDGKPVNTNAAEKFRKAAELLETRPQSTSSNLKDDLLSQVLGPDKPGRLRAMGRGMSLSKVACFQMKNKFMADMQKRLVEMQEEIVKLKNQKHEPEVGETSAARSVNKRYQPQCVLVDWAGTDENVAEGRILSSDPNDFVNDIPLGPNSVKVLVQKATKPDAFLWRPAPNMFYVEQAVGELIAWPANKCLDLDQPDGDVPKSPRTSSLNKCKLMDWSKKDGVVAEGRWQSKDPKALVNGLPLGPNAVKVFVDVVLQPETFLWRPTPEMIYLEESLMSYVAWPANEVVFEKSTDEQISSSTDQAVGAATSRKSPLVQSSKKKTQTSVATSVATERALGSKTTATSRKSPLVQSSKKKTQQPSQYPLRRSPRINQGKVVKENQKCKLMDITGNERVVAEGRWSSNDPEKTVHNVPLGPNAVRVWVDIVKVNNAAVWRPSYEIEFMEDAFGTCIAWPEDKVIMC